MHRLVSLCLGRGRSKSSGSGDGREEGYLRYGSRASTAREVGARRV